MFLAKSLHNKFICFIFAPDYKYQNHLEQTSQLHKLALDFMNGTTLVRRRGKSYPLELSDDKLKNEIMRLYGDRFLFVKPQGANIDSYINKVCENQYQMKVWNVYYTWGEGLIFGEIAHHRNNTDSVLTFTKQGDSWRVDLHERRYYGQPDRDTKIQ